MKRNNVLGNLPSIIGKERANRFIYVSLYTFYAPTQPSLLPPVAACLPISHFLETFRVTAATKENAWSVRRFAARNRAGGMMRDTSRRRQEIIGMLHDQGSVQVHSLSEQFQVSTQTIRKDLA